jgi:hypothetical protein
LLLRLRLWPSFDAFEHGQAIERCFMCASKSNSLLTLLFSLLLAWPLALRAADPSAPADAVTPDGGRYYGPLVEGKLQGQGRIEWGNGERYVGGFVDGLFSGQGRLESGSGQVYQGEFRAGRMAGQGRLQLQDGSVYVGEFRDDHFNGLGRYEMRDGAVYEGAFEHDWFHGIGRLIDQEGEYYGEFKQGQQSGQGEASYRNGSKYRGEFARGRIHGKGRFENQDGEVFEGDFDDGQFTGTGTYVRKDGARYEGGFRDWRPHGAGRYTDAKGNLYEGDFVGGQLEGSGRFVGKDGTLYEGEFKAWRFDGQGRLALPNGDVYQGGFEHGVYQGQGTLTYAKPLADGRTHDIGVWRYGMLPDENEQRQARINVETALYNQRRLLDEALASLAPRYPGRINLYLLAVAGDGSQEVFRREVEFVRNQFAETFGTQGHSLVLINSRNTVDSAPMATVTSIREALHAIAARMDKEQDILFLFLSSHGSKEHELALNQNRMDLRGLPATELAQLLRDAGIRWKAIVVSACYSGGFIDPIKDDHTLVIAAARHDRRSFGCSDENDFTYFGRAYFQQALPQSASFQEAFVKAERLVRERELDDQTESKRSEPNAADFSLPQIYSPAPVEEHLQRWWAQAAQRRVK